MKILITQSFVAEVSEKGFEKLKEDTSETIEKCLDNGLDGECKIEEYTGSRGAETEWDDEECGVEPDDDEE